MTAGFALRRLAPLVLFLALLAVWEGACRALQVRPVLPARAFGDLAAHCSAPGG